MKFYETDNVLQEAITAADKPVRVRIQIDFAGNGSFESVFEYDSLEADFYGLKEAAGGTSARGEVLLDNPQEIYSHTGTGAHRQEGTYHRPEERDTAGGKPAGGLAGYAEG
jgi:hypothetical protein